MTSSDTLREWTGKLSGDLTGALSACLVTLPVAIGAGYLALLPLGADAAVLGPRAGLFGAAFTGIVTALFGGAPGMVSGPKTSLAVLSSALVATLLANPDIRAAGDPNGLLIGLLGVTVLLAATFQIVLGAAGLGQMIKFIPYPVTAGLMNGLALIMVVGQVDLFFNGGDVETAGLAVALAALLATYGARLAGFGVIDGLAGLALGAALHHGLSAGGFAMGPGLGAFAAGLPDLPDVWGAAHWIAEDPSRLEPLLVPALLIALVGALESLLSAVAVDTQTGRRHASNREVIGQGLGNIVVAFTSSIAGGGSPSRSLASIRCGGDSRRAGVFQGLFVGLIALFAGPGLNSLPLAALAGVLVVYALDMVDGRTRRLFRQGPGRGWASPSSVAVDMAVIYGVALLTVTVDLVAAVAVGFSVSAIRFIARAGSRPIHRLTRGDVIRSKQVRHPGDRKRLDRDGKQILFAELQGPVFFGATDNLLRSLEPELAGTRWLILDMRRVDEIDATGVQILDRIRSRLGDLGGITVLSSLGEGHPAWRFLTDCGAVGTKEGPTVFKDGDTALAWAETALLADGGEDTATELPLSAMDMLVSLDPAEIDILAALMERRVLDSGSALARKGEPASHMFFIALGTVSVRDSNGIRLAGIGPGLTVGEMALLTSGIRSADVIADRHLVAWTLGKPAFEALVSDHPRLAAKLLKAIAAEQSERLRQTSEEVVALLQ